MRGTFEKLKADTKAKPEDVGAARTAWMEAQKLTTAAKTEYEAAEAAGASEGAA